MNERGRVHALLAAVANLFVIASMGWPWTSRGQASVDPGYRLAARLIGGHFAVFVGRWAGAVLFLIPMCGAVGLFALGFRSRTARLLRVVLGMLALVLSATVVVAIRVKHFDRIGVGGWLAIVGSVAVVTTAAIPERS